MADIEHMRLALRGARAISEWRQAHPGEQLDLTKAGFSSGRVDLTGANLSGDNLRQACLEHADLSGADLSGAYMRGIDLKFARLRATDLSKANLRGADLVGADLTGANLSGADLSWARLFMTNLSRANLSGADLSLTSLANVDLDRTKGLRRVRYDVPISIGIDTLVASIRGGQGQLSAELTTFFFRAGVPEEILGALPSIVATVKYHTCFISYGQPDLAFAKELCQGLEAKAVSCWLYDMGKTPGERTLGEIAWRRREADKMIVLCSAGALIRPGVRKEIEEQIDEDETKLIPVSLDALWREKGFLVERDGRDLKPFLLGRDYVDFASKPYEEALDDLLRGLRRPEVKKTRRSKKPS